MIILALIMAAAALALAIAAMVIALRNVGRVEVKRDWVESAPGMPGEQQNSLPPLQRKKTMWDD